MRVTVAITTYNSAATIRATLESVLRQTVPPDEILVVNDGSTDDTRAILRTYDPRITVIEQENKGVSGAHNVLFQHAQGDMIAYLDHDDIWHPRYLEVQGRAFANHPNAVAFFTGHVNFSGSETYRWSDELTGVDPKVEVMDPVNFISRYTKATGPFASPSYCCVPRRTLLQVGEEPFDPRVLVCVDAYLFYLLALLGPVVYTPMPLAAYRVSRGSLSGNRLRNLQEGVYVFEILDERYYQSASKPLFRAFRQAFAIKRREYAKVLMGTGNLPEARKQLRDSMGNTGNIESLIKSLALSLLSYMPSSLNPHGQSSQQ